MSKGIICIIKIGIYSKIEGTSRVFKLKQPKNRKIWKLLKVFEDGEIVIWKHLPIQFQVVFSLIDNYHEKMMEK